MFWRINVPKNIFITVFCFITYHPEVEQPKVLKSDQKQPNKKRLWGSPQSEPAISQGFFGLLVTTSGVMLGKKNTFFVTLFCCPIFQESKATWTIPVLWWATDLVTLPAADHHFQQKSTRFNGTLTMPRLGGFAVEKKVPWNKNVGFFFMYTQQKYHFSSNCGFPLVTTHCSMNFHFMFFGRKWWCPLLGVSLLLQVRLPSLQSLEKQLEARCFVQTKTDQAGHQKWFLKCFRKKRSEMNRSSHDFCWGSLAVFSFFSGGLGC